MREFILSPSNRLFKDRFTDLKEFVDGKWISPVKPVFGMELDPREDDIEYFDSETEALKALKSRLDNK